MSRRTVAAYAAVCLLLSSTVLALRVTDARKPDTLETALESIGTRITDWQLASTATLNAVELQAVRPTAYIARTYSRGDLQAGVFVAYYALQRAGESMHSPRNCLPGEGWDIWQQGSVQIDLDGKPVDINRTLIQNAGNRLAVLYWYQSRSRIIANEYVGKLLLVRDALLNRSTGGALVRITLPESAAMGPEGAQFAAGLMREVQRCLGR
jgi:EpsI family protein